MLEKYIEEYTKSIIDNLSKLPKPVIWDLELLKSITTLEEDLEIMENIPNYESFIKQLEFEKHIEEYTKLTIDNLSKLPKPANIIWNLPDPNEPIESITTLEEDLEIMEKSSEYHKIIDKTKNLFLKGIEYKKVVDKN